MTAQVRRLAATKIGAHRQSAEYVADMVRELVTIAEDAGLDTVAHLLTVVQAEAEKELGPRRH